MKTRNFTALLLTAALSAGPLFAQTQPSDDAKKLEKYAVEIATDANPVSAREFLADQGFRDKAASIDQTLSQKLTAYSEALRDLEQTLAQNMTPEDHNRISSELSSRMDAAKPLCEIGICPEPEKLLTWIGKYKKTYPAQKTAIINRAVRKWEVVFDTQTTSMSVDWGQAKSLKAPIIQKTDWEKMVIRERNAVLSKLAYNAAMGKTDQKFLAYDESIGRYLDDREKTRQAATQLINSGLLTSAQLSNLSGKPFDQQLYLLGNYFDGSSLSGHPELKPYVDRVQSQRTSLPTESLNSQQREMLSGMLQTSLMNEVKGTKAGDRISSFYKGSNPQISVEYCNGCYSKYENGKIIIDEATVEQYMRVKGYKAEDLFKNKAAVDDITAFISPAFVRASSYQMSDAYFRAQGTYNPSVQEAGVSASALQALYTSEKMKSDAGFKSLFEGMSPNSDYASKVMITQREFQNGGSKDFASRIGMLYYSDLPTTAAAKSQVISAISSELLRRQALSPAEQTQAEQLAILSEDEVYQMSVEEFTGSVGDMKKETLLKVQTGMLSPSSQDGYYRSFMGGIRRDYNSLSASAAPKTRVPAPGA